MENNYTVMDVIQAMIADPSWEPDDNLRTQLALGIYGQLFLLG